MRVKAKMKMKMKMKQRDHETRKHIHTLWTLHTDVHGSRRASWHHRHRRCLLKPSRKCYCTGGASAAYIAWAYIGTRRTAYSIDYIHSLQTRSQPDQMPGLNYDVGGHGNSSTPPLTISSPQNRVWENCTYFIWPMGTSRTLPDELYVFPHS